MGTRHVVPLLTVVVFVVLALAPAAPVLAQGLTAAEVDAIIAAAARSLSDTSMVIAVTDREGIPLGVFAKTSGNRGDADLAVNLARTGAFFSNDQAPLSSRTVRFISGIHFPPGISNTPNAALYGIENTNRGCRLSNNFNPGQEITPSRSLGGGVGMGIVTGKADVFDSDPGAVNPGGVPIFKDGRVAGGIGVAGVDFPQAEFAAFTGSVVGGTDARFGPRPARPGVVVLDGIALPFVSQTTRPGGSGPGEFVGNYIRGPQDSPRPGGVPDGYLVGPLGSAELAPEEVDRIVRQAEAQANRTRAGIRLPLGSPTRMMISVSDLQGNLLAIFRMPDATVFSIDVSASKARNVAYFSAQRVNPADLPGVPPGTAVTNRTISFGAQPLFPPGIDGSGPGPFFDLFLRDTAQPCSQGFDNQNRGNQSGIVFFPGSAPLYRDGQLIGGLGVSGDGVEQDDVVTEAGQRGFEAPANIRADQILIGGVRLPYFKFNRNPTRP
jgi:uncharacterized protein GlcG (DUF336 family)